MHPFDALIARTQRRPARGLARLLVVGATALTLTLTPSVTALAGPGLAETATAAIFQDEGGSSKIVPVGSPQDEADETEEEAAGGDEIDEEDIESDEEARDADERETDADAGNAAGERGEVLTTPGKISKPFDLQPTQWMGVLDGRLIEPFAVVERPARISADAIGLDAPVTQREIVGGVMQTPKDEFEVSWYKETAKPGEEGNAVFAGHLNWYGVPQAVFYFINQLEQGNRITVTNDAGEAFTYEVEWVKLIDVEGADLNEVVGPTDASSLTLITCGGDWNPATGEYDQRTVVRAVLVTE